MKSRICLAHLMFTLVLALRVVAADPATGAASSAKLSPAAAEVARLAGSGVGDDVVLAYIKNSKSTFNLSADEILYLKDKGVSSAVISAMLSHDSAAKPDGQPAAAAASGASAAAAPAASDATEVKRETVKDAPPEVTYFYEGLAPYGEWVRMDNYGWCWQPHEAAGKDNPWQPYCDGGHWADTDSGWFWDSEYAWGWASFHYGRWVRDSQVGWVWAPDRTWGPAWVIWRTVEDLVGWAPLPPRSVNDSRSGWKFNGMAVSSIFDFGVRQESYVFVPLKDFTQKDLTSRRVGVAEVARVFGRSTIVNGYTFNNSTMVNQGISTKQVAAASHASIPHVMISDAPDSWVPGAPLPLGGPPILYRHGLRPPLHPPLVQFQHVDPHHPYIHHRPGPGGPGGPGFHSPGGPGGPGGPSGGRPGGPAPGGAPGKAPSGGAPGKRP